jgi:hypothetical protein
VASSIFGGVRRIQLSYCAGRWRPLRSNWLITSKLILTQYAIQASALLLLSFPLRSIRLNLAKMGSHKMSSRGQSWLISPLVLHVNLALSACRLGKRKPIFPLKKGNLPPRKQRHTFHNHCTYTYTYINEIRQSQQPTHQMSESPTIPPSDEHFHQNTVDGGRYKNQSQTEFESSLLKTAVPLFKRKVEKLKLAVYDSQRPIFREIPRRR